MESFNSLSDYKTLNNGHKMPKFGLGTWLSEPGKVQSAVEHAIDIGYRHIDCAHCYQNEHEVGLAIKNKIDQGVVKRQDLFITSKLWNTYHHPDKIDASLKVTLDNLKLDYLDLYLIHFPQSFKLNENHDLMILDKDGYVVPDDIHYTETFNKLIEIYKNSNILKAIGVSNFNIFQLKQIFEKCSMKPAINQLELHPYLTEAELKKFCEDNDIYVTAYSPMGNPGRPSGGSDKDVELMMNDILIEMAKKYNKTTAQLLIRWSIQNGCICIPKSVTHSRIQENSQILDFEISKEDFEKITNLNKNLRYGNPDFFSKCKYTPFPRDGVYSE